MLKNIAGETDVEKVNLIPVNATLKVEAIYPDTSSHADIASLLSEHTSSSKIFAK